MRGTSILVCIAVLLGAASEPAYSQSQQAQPQSQAIPEQGEISPQPLQAPMQEFVRPTKWGEPTDVRIMLYVIDVDEIVSASQNFSASVYYEARWVSPSLKHEGPGPRLMPTNAVWTPRLAIVNQQQVWNAFPSYVEIYPDGEVVLRQKLWGWFSQPLDLRDFPLDRQILNIHIVAAGLRQTEVSLVPLVKPNGGGSAIAKDFSLADFDVTSWLAEPRGYIAFEGGAAVAGFIMEINVARKPNYYFWKLIVPLCLIVGMSWVPRWIDPKEVGTSIGIAATSFLTLVAYLFATAVLLPRFSYFTRMDLFILLATLMVFVSLIQTVVTAAYQRRWPEAAIRRVNLWSRAAYPAALIGVLVLAFLN